MLFFLHLSKLQAAISLSLIMALISSFSVKADDYQALSLEAAVLQAQKNDPWLVANRHNQNALISQSLAATSLAAPKVSVAVTNIASDSFSFNQEPMTQFKFGVSQQFPRGDTRALKQQKFERMAGQQPFLRQDRKAKVVIEISQIWLEIFKAQQTIALIEKERPLFEQLEDIVESNYSSAFGATRQYDIVQAELELTRLDDRVNQVEQQKDMAMAKLYKWLKYGNSSSSIQPSDVANNSIVISGQLPNIHSTIPEDLNIEQNIIPNQLVVYFNQHPALKALEQKIKASKSDIALAKQKNKPSWAVKADYGYRGNDPLGQSRSDLFSLGVTFDLPLLTKNKQDQELKSALSQTESIKTNKWLLMRQMFSDFEKLAAQLQKLERRQKLYQQRLLPQIREQAEATLTAYSNDDGSFAEVVHARIAELNAGIDALEIDTEKQLTQIKLNYFFIKDLGQMVKNKNNDKHFTALGESYEQ